MKRFWLQARLSYKGSYDRGTIVDYVATVLVRPVSLLILFTLLGRLAENPSAANRYLVGTLAYAVPQSFMSAIPQTFYNERVRGTLGFLFTASGNRLLIYGSRVPLYFPSTIMSVALCMISAILLLGLDVANANYAVLAISLLFILLSCAAFAMFIGCLTIIFNDLQTIRAICAGIFLGLCGVIIPIDALPAGLGLISAVLPLSHGLEAFRLGMEGTALAGVWQELVLELVVGCSYGLLGFGLFMLTDLLGRRWGILI